MALSDAAKIAENLADVSMRRLPRWPESVWRPFVNYAQEEQESANRTPGANSLATLLAHDQGNLHTVGKGLEYFQWLSTQPFMQNETATSEPTYRVLHAYSPLLMYGVALSRGTQDEIEACRSLARSHFSWLLLGIGLRPGRAVRNHHLGDNDGCILVGDGNEVNDMMRMVVSAGMRSWKRESNIHTKFMFTENTATSVIVAQGLGTNYPLNKEWVQRDIMLGYSNRWGLLPWALTHGELNAAMAFAGNPMDVSLATIIASWCLPYKLPYQIDRYASGAVATAMLQPHNSSTDHMPVEILEANGTLLRASLSDGIRSTKEPQVVDLNNQRAYILYHASGSGQALSVPRPEGTISYSVRSDPGRVQVISGSTPIPPQPQPPSGSSPFTYLGQGGLPSELLIGSKTSMPSANLREIHGDPANGWVRRWVVEPI